MSKDDDLDLTSETNDQGTKKGKKKTASKTQSIGLMVKSAHGCEMLERLKKTDRLIFPGEQRPPSVTSVLVDLSNPVNKRPKSGKRRDQCAEEFDITKFQVKQRVTREEMDNIVARLSRPTHMTHSRASITWDKRASIVPNTETVRRRIKTPVNYLTDVVKPNRFQGNKKVSRKDVSDIVARLSQAPTRTTNKVTKEEKDAGILNSYRWRGVKNC